MAVVVSSTVTSFGTPRRRAPYAGDAPGAGAPAFPRGREGDNLSHQTRAHRVDIFFGLSQDEMSRVTAYARNLRKARGEFIYMPGDRADFVYVLRQGRVRLSVLAESGKEIAIDIIEPGEVFGEFALVDESLRSNMTQALDDVTIWVFNKRDFAQLLVQTKLAMNYIRLVGDRRRRMEKKLSDITSKDVSARVCELLHELSVSASEIDATAREYLVPLTHYDVASLIGASRQTTTSILNQLERSGIIELGRGWIRVKCLKDLQTYVGSILVTSLQVFSCLCQLTDIPLM
ncbi:MAG TPA: Crp/Fnr family transcriptional regulator [Blastocatellia bacterium]|nr:Crp/Fnr family transcriptional regulator [Blastocatellia bacterium]